jgi:hypothetical protein
MTVDWGGRNPSVRLRVAQTASAVGRDPAFGNVEALHGDEWSAPERALLDAALGFFGAAGAVIEYRGPEPPRLRYDVERLQRVRDAMATLDDQIRRADAAGLSPERIAGITRLEPEMVDLILEGRRPAATAEGGG